MLKIEFPNLFYGNPTLINALPRLMETENLEGTRSGIVRMAESESQQIALLANVLLITDELLPRAATNRQLFNQTCRIDEPPRKPSDRQNWAPEQRELKKQLQRFVDQLRDSFFRKHALELIFTDDGGVRLCANMYISMDGIVDKPEWFPSPIYQVFHNKSN